MENNVRIDGEKVILTSITYDDCEDFINWRNSDYIKSKFIYQKDISLEEQKEWIRTKVETGQVAQFIIWDKNLNKKVGCVYLQNIDDNKKDAEFGILIAEGFGGMGFGSESAKLIIKYGFEKLGLKKIYLRVLKDNKIARRAYEKAGFISDNHEEEIMINGRNTEVVFMSINR